MVINLTNGEGMTRIPILDDEKTGAKLFYINKAGYRTHYGCAARLNIDDKLVRTYNSDGTASSVYVNEYGETFTSIKQYYVVGENDQIVIIPYYETRYNDDGVLIGIDNRRAYEQEFLPNGNEIITDNRHLSGSIIERDLSEELTKIKETLDSYMETVAKHVKVARGTYLLVSDLQTYAIDHSVSDIESLINSGVESTALLTMEDYDELNFYLSQDCQLSSADKTNMCNYILARDTKNREKALADLRCFMTTLVEYMTKLRAYPRMFMKTEDAIKGYNENGELVAVCYNDGRGFKVFRNSTGEITHLEGLDGSIITFKYNPMKALCCVTDTAGNKTELEYEFLTGHVNETISRVKYNDSRILDIAFHSSSDMIVGISSLADRKKVTLDMAFTSLDEMNYYYHVNKITHLSAPSDADASNDSSYSEVDFVSFSYEALSNVSVSNVYIADGRKAELTYKNANKNIVVLDNTNNRIYYYSIVNGKVSSAARYTYLKLNMDDILFSNASNANLSTFDEYTFIPGEYESSELNEFNKPSLTRSGGKKLVTGSEESYVTTYHYNLDRQLLKTVTVISISGTDKTYTVIERFFYDTSGRLTRKESFVEGEELTSGILVEETVYSDDGRHAKSFTYNTLDSSSKTYTEKELDESGRVISEMDSTGRAARRFEYDGSGNVICEILPNGSRYAYGRDSLGRITSITHSSDIGEENSTHKIYDGDFLKELRSGNNVVKYTYDERGRVKSIDLNDTENYETVIYTGDDTDRQVTKVTRGNTVFTTHRNKLGNIIYKNILGVDEEYVEGVSTAFLGYDNQNRLTSYFEQGYCDEAITYDDADHITSFSRDGSVLETFEYDAEGYLTRKVIDGTSYEYTYTEGRDKKIKSIATSGTTVSPTFDAIGRSTGKKTTVNGSTISEEQISYLKFGDRATNLPGTIKYGDKTGGSFAMRDTLKYKYDVMGNITEVFENGLTIARYEYDSLGRLKREDNRAFGKTTVFSYDDNGNILAKHIYAFTMKDTNELKELTPEDTISYTYDNDSDRLLSYNGETCAYDSLGNPTTYRGTPAAWGSYSKYLFQLGNNSFSYDLLRGRRDDNFVYGHGDEVIGYTNGVYVMRDHAGVIAVSYIDSPFYYFRRNAQGDVIALLDNTGKVVVKYYYDAWGKCKAFDANGNEIPETADHIANHNPFRYRGYYYEKGAKLYYLKSRFYDPETGRFISPDDTAFLAPDLINGLNLYAYCGNNPVNKVDPNGNFAISIGLLFTGIAAGAAFGGGIDFGIQLYKEKGNVDNVDFGSVVNSTITGAALGLSTALGVGYLGPAIAGTSTISAGTVATAFATSTATSAAAGAGGYIIQEAMNGRFEEIQPQNVIGHAGIVALEGAFNFGIGGIVGSMQPTIGRNGKFLRSKEWYAKFLITQEFTNGAKLPLDRLRKGLWG